MHTRTTKRVLLRHSPVCAQSSKREDLTSKSTNGQGSNRLSGANLAESLRPHTLFSPTKGIKHSKLPAVGPPVVEHLHVLKRAD